MQNSQTAKTNNEWKSYSLGELGEYLNGRAFKSTDWKKTGIPIIRIQNLNNHQAPFNYSSEVFEDRYRVENEELLVSWSASLGAYIWDRGSGWLNQHIFKVIPNEKVVEKRLLYYAIKNIIRELYAQAHGSGMVHVTKPVFEAQVVMIPEDKRLQLNLVSRFDDMLESVDISINKIQKAKRLIQKFRQSVLSAAVTGKLTEEWREKNQNYKSSEEILNQIKEQRLVAGSNKNKLQDIYTHTEQNDNDQLPEKWSYVSLDKLCNSFSYGTSAKSQTEGKVPVLRMGNLQRGEIDWNSLVYTSDAKEIEKYTLKSGDVLFNRTNSPELVGKTSIYRGERPAIYAGYLIKINNYSQLDSEYLNYCLNSGYANNYCYQVKSDGVSQSNINAQKLAKFEVPFCSIEEQQEIVKKVKSMFEVADLLEKQIEIAGKKTDKLTQSILAKAFRGEL